MRSEQVTAHSRVLFWASTLGFLATISGLCTWSPVAKYPIHSSILYTIAFALLFTLLHSFPGHWRAGKQWALLLVMAVAVRAPFLAYPSNDDVSRYIWEGVVLNHGANPYLQAPDDSALQPLAQAIPEIWRQVNHKDLTACYPPLALLLFRLAAAISPTTLFFKIWIMLFDLATIGILVMMLRLRRLPARHLLLYALNPLVLVFIAGEGHLDSIQTCFLLLGLYWVVRGAAGRGFSAIGCAAMSKYFALVATPFLVTARNWKKAIMVPAVMVLCYLPFWNTGTQIFASVVPFGAVWNYNDSISALMRPVLGAHTIWGSLVFLAVCLSVVFLLVQDTLRSTYLALACLLLSLTVLHPWYLTLITPFLVLFPSRAWLYLHFAMVFTFPTMSTDSTTGIWHQSGWLKLAEYLPFFGLLLWDKRHNRRILPITRFREAQALSIIIPTLNEASNIALCLEALKKQSAIAEMIVADAGSDDRTPELARSMGAIVTTAERGRGIQINAGIAKCSGDVVLILHADCILHEGMTARILSELNRNPHIIGGALGMKYDHRSLKNALICKLNNWRAQWTGISFGDQAQFFRREALKTMGGFPSMMLMEDVELSLRLKETGTLCFIPKGVTVSNRRWEHRGFWNNVGSVVWLCLSYLIQRRLGLGDTQGRNFYRHYYCSDKASTR